MINNILQHKQGIPFLLFLVILVQQGSAFVIPSKTSTKYNNAALPASVKFGWRRNSQLFSTVLSENQELEAGIKAIQESNKDLLNMLENLREKPFFRLYSVDILASCEYMPQELFECYSESCEIYPVEEEEVPEVVKQVDAEEHDFELDGWARWDMPTDDYYDTMEFPEDFTGYDGSDVWQFIHERICFPEVKDDDEEWKADFNRAVSGLHSMISAQVVRGLEKKVEDGEDVSEHPWTDPTVEFARRLGLNGETPHALENLYFTYMLLLTAVAKSRDRFLRDCNSGKIDEDAASSLRPILEYPLLDDPTIQIASKKLRDHAVQACIKDECVASALWEARMRTRELMRIMNCVQCNKCRFHGKVSVLGLSTALRILLGRAGEGGDPNRVHRVELAALMTCVGKFAEGVNYCSKMMEK